VDQTELIEWARAEAGRILGGGVSLAAAAEFLSANAGGVFAAQAGEVADRATTFHAVGKGTARLDDTMADLLVSWAKYAEDGLATSLPLEALIRVEASTDLMEQVQRLLDDNAVFVAAPVVLAGAALEEFLRSMMVGCTETITGPPSLSKYASALRKCGKIDTQDEKDITAWTGHRNNAAHGDFDKLSLQGAQIMVDGINLFMRKKTPAGP